MNYENKELCKKCGGICCKKSGCDYFVSDFKTINKQSLLEILDSGNVSIVSTFFFETLNNGNKIAVPFLYLRARNKDRGIVDLFSMKKECSMLTETGCKYDINNRPGGGVNLIPTENACVPLLDPLEEMSKWKSYQGLLSKLVRRYTGKSVDTVIKEDVEEVMYQVMTDQFNGISKREIIDIKKSILNLIECFKEEYLKASKRAKEDIRVYKKEYKNN